MKKHSIFIALAMIVLALSIACNPETSSGPGTLKVLINPTSDSRTIGSNTSLVTEKYRLEAVPELEGSASMITLDIAKTEKSRTLELNPGNWTITVYALNGNGKDIGSGSAAVTVTPGTLTECTVIVKEYAGKGTLSARLSGMDPRWNVRAELCTSMGDVNPVEYKLDKLGNIYYGSQPVEHGSYLFKLYHDDSILWIEAVDIVANSQTNADVKLEQNGNLAITQMPDMAFFSVTSDVVNGEVSNGETYTFTSTSAATWFVDGVAQSAEPSLTFVFKPVDLKPGSHKISAVVDDGSFARSDTKVVSVAAVIPVEEITLAVDGKPLQNSMSAVRLGYTINLSIVGYDPGTTYKVYYDDAESSKFTHTDGNFSILALEIDPGTHTFRVDGVKDGKTITGKTYTIVMEDGLSLRPFHPVVRDDGTIELKVEPIDSKTVIPAGGKYTWKIWNNSSAEKPAVEITQDSNTYIWTPEKPRVNGAFVFKVDYVNGEYTATTTECIHYFLPHFTLAKPEEIRVGKTAKFVISDSLSIVNPDAYIYDWKINGTPVEGAHGPELSVKVAKEGNNTLEISYYAKSDWPSNKETLRYEFTALPAVVVPETRDFKTWYGMVSGCLFGTSSDRPGTRPDFTVITPEELTAFDRDMKAAMASNDDIDPVRCLVDPDTKDFSVEFDMYKTSRYIVNQRTDGTWYGYIRTHRDNGDEVFCTMDLSGSSRTAAYDAYWNKLPAEIQNGPVLVEIEIVTNPDSNPDPERGVRLVLHGGTDAKAEARRYADILGAGWTGHMYEKRDGKFVYSVYDYANTVCIDVCDFVYLGPDPRYGFNALMKQSNDARQGIGKMPSLLFMNMSDEELGIYKTEMRDYWNKEAHGARVEVDAIRNANGFKSMQRITYGDDYQYDELVQDSMGNWTENITGTMDGEVLTGRMQYEKPAKSIVLDLPSALEVSAYGKGQMGSSVQEMVTFYNVSAEDVRQILERYSLEPDDPLAGYYSGGDMNINGFMLNAYVVDNGHGGYGVTLNYTGDGKPIPAKPDFSHVSINLKINDSIEPLAGDTWLNATSYSINAIGTTENLEEKIVTDISKPVVLLNLKAGDLYEITVNAINADGSIIGTGKTSVRKGDRSAEIVVKELVGNGNISVVLKGFSPDAAPTVKYGQTSVEMRLESGVWKGLLAVHAGKERLVVETPDFNRTLGVRVVSGRTTDVVIFKENGTSGIIVENNITKTPEIVISELQAYDPASRTFKLSAAVPGYPKAEFTWKLNGVVQKGKETIWQIPPSDYKGYLYVNVFTKCGDLFVSNSYELKI